MNLRTYASLHAITVAAMNAGINIRIKLIQYDFIALSSIYISESRILISFKIGKEYVRRETDPVKCYDCVCTEEMDDDKCPKEVVFL